MSQAHSTWQPPQTLGGRPLSPIFKIYSPPPLSLSIHLSVHTCQHIHVEVGGHNLQELICSFYLWGLGE